MIQTRHVTRRMTNAPRKILVTSALPYANGSIHLGHLVEYIQTDIWVRFQKMQGNSCHYVCADDTHGTPIMLRAEKEGITPEQLIARVWQEHYDDFKAFMSTSTITARPILPKHASCECDLQQAEKRRPDRQAFHRTVLRSGKRNVFTRSLHQGRMPQVPCQRPVRRYCEVCGAAYTTSEVINPYSAVSGAKPVMKASDHYFFKLSAPAARNFCRNGLPGN